MKLKKIEWILLLMVVISFGVAYYFNGILPERIASHWDASGQVNGYASKFWGLFLMPMVLVVMFLIFIYQLYINQQLSYPIYFIPIFVLINLGLYFFINYLFKGYTKEDIKFLYKMISIKNIKRTILTEFKNDY